MSPSPVSSTPILRRTLIWSAIATAVLAIVAGGVGYLVAQGRGSSVACSVSSWLPSSSGSPDSAS